MWKIAPEAVAALCAGLIGFLKLVLHLANPVVPVLSPLSLDLRSVLQGLMSASSAPMVRLL